MIDNGYCYRSIQKGGGRIKNLDMQLSNEPKNDKLNIADLLVYVVCRVRGNSTIKHIETNRYFYF